MHRFFLSFVSPFGRLEPLAFWWRQVVIAALLGPCAYALAYYEALVERASGGTLSNIIALFTQLTPLSVLSTGLGFLGGDEAGTSAVLLNVNGDPLGGGLEMLLALVLCLLLAWCQAAIAIQRVRDTRFGPPLLLACLPYVWVATNSVGGSILGGLSLLASIVIYCLPSRGTPLPPLGERKFRKLTPADLYSGATERHSKPKNTES